VLKPEIATVLPLADSAAALEQSKAGHTRGKIIITMPK
jgi:NADPH:quinone reductase-like Zn-dependent oxidoreductase